MSTIKNLVIENARIIYRNFSGKPSKFNVNGARSFHVILEDHDEAMALKNEGWNVKIRAPRTPDEDPMMHIEVFFSFNNFAPKIYNETKNRSVLMDEDTVDELDFAEIESADVEIRPRAWEANGNTGIKAYLKCMHVTLEEDVFADKYRRD